MPHTVPISDWEHAKRSFESFFDGYGLVTTDEQTLSFQSLAHHVATSFSIARDGTMGASMPLHQISAPFTELSFDTESRQVTCRAEGMSYTYRVPPQLWSE
jgi:hypothetical protein